MLKKTNRNNWDACYGVGVSVHMDSDGKYDEQDLYSRIKLMQEYQEKQQKLEQKLEKQLYDKIYEKKIMKRRKIICFVMCPIILFIAALMILQLMFF